MPTRFDCDEIAYGSVPDYTLDARHLPTGFIETRGYFLPGRVALLRMSREGRIDLPAPSHKVVPCRSFRRRTPQAEPGAVLEGMVHELSGFRLEPVERKSSGLWNELID